MHRYKKPNIIYTALKKSSALLNDFLKNKRLLLLIIISGILFMLLLIRFKRIFFTALLISLGGSSMIYQRYFRFGSYVGFELCMMATLLTALAYGPAFGAFAGFSSLFLAFVLCGNFKHTSFISLLVLPLIGLIVPLFSHLPLLYVGMLMTIIYDIIILPLYIALGSRIVPSIIFFITHLFFNYWVFSFFAPVILSFMR